LIRSVLGLIRSVAIYWRPGRQAALREWYRQWVPADGLVFDVGAHLGDRSVAFSDLGARVIALEPQPALLPALRFLTRNHPRIEVLASAVGSTPGQATLRVSAATPTVSSLSTEWIRSVRSANPGFRRVRWESTVTVPVTTLDALIERYGLPAFCKIDVEGFEAEVLQGVSQPLPAVSFEFIPGAMAITEACVHRLESLAAYRYNAALAEQRRFVFKDWIGPDEVLHWVRVGGPGPRSGDVYARLCDAPRS